MPFEVWNIEQERIGGLQVNPPDDPHEWFTVGLYGTPRGAGAWLPAPRHHRAAT